MLETERVIEISKNDHEFDSRYSYFVVNNLKQEEGQILLEAAPIENNTGIVVLKPGLTPRKLFIERFHDDSDDDDYAVDSYSIEDLRGFYLDPKTGDMVDVISSRNDEKPVIKPGYTFYKLTENEDNVALERIEIIPDKVESCLFLRV